MLLVGWLVCHQIADASLCRRQTRPVPAIVENNTEYEALMHKAYMRNGKRSAKIEHTQSILTWRRSQQQHRQ